jgi:adenine/guanine phosphoribosyltransferase-like PRPP-binding protein
VGVGFLIELGYLDGRKVIGDKYDVFSLIQLNTTDG